MDFLSSCMAASSLAFSFSILLRHSLSSSPLFFVVSNSFLEFVTSAYKLWSCEAIVFSMEESSEDYSWKADKTAVWDSSEEASEAKEEVTYAIHESRVERSASRLNFVDVRESSFCSRSWHFFYIWWSSCSFFRICSPSLWSSSCWFLIPFFLSSIISSIFLISAARNSALF